MEFQKLTTLSGNDYLQVESSTGDLWNFPLSEVSLRLVGGTFHFNSVNQRFTFTRSEVTLPVALTDELLLEEITNLFIAPAGGGGGGGDATAANQDTQINLESDIRTAVESSATSLNEIEASAIRSGDYGGSTAALTTAVTTPIAANLNRRGLIVQTGAGGFVRIGLNILPTPTTGIRVPPNSLVSFTDFVPTNAIQMRTETGVNNITFFEA